MMRQRRALLATLAVAVTILGGCGASPSTISAAATSELSGQVRAVRAAAVAGNSAAAKAQLTRLRADVATLRAHHQVTSQRAAQILSAASQVSVLLGTLTTTTTAPSTTAPTPTVPPTTTTAPTTTVPSTTTTTPPVTATAPATSPPASNRHSKSGKQDKKGGGAGH